MIDTENNPDPIAHALDKHLLECSILAKQNEKRLNELEVITKETNELVHKLLEDFAADRAVNSLWYKILGGVGGLIGLFLLAIIIYLFTGQV